MHNKIKNCIFVFLISFFLTFALNSSLFFPNLYKSYYFVGLASIVAFTTNFAFWLSMTLLAGSSKIFRFSIYPVTVALQVLCISAAVQYGTSPVELSIALYNACWQEILIYLTLKNLIIFLIFLAGIYVLLYLVAKFSVFKMVRENKMALGACVAVAIFSLFIPYLYNYVKCKSFQISERDSITFDALKPISSTQSFCIALYDFLTPTQLSESAVYNSKQISTEMPDIVLLYIGEAYRADHSPHNGYKRNTMPSISNEKNIINLPNVHSRATQTLSSIYSILTLTSPETGKATHNSFLNILKKHNYKNYLLVGANTGGRWYLTPGIAQLFQNQIHLHSRPKSPEEYKSAINSIVCEASPVFVLIEDGAGHLPYHSENYTFGVATEIDKYDNCLIDVDSRVFALINELRDKSAILFFTSDHGESFGEGGRYGHAGPISAREQTHVCSFIWYSDKYAEANPEIIKNLKINANIFISHDYIYHTIISMSGIWSKIQIKNQDMTLAQ